MPNCWRGQNLLILSLPLVLLEPQALYVKHLKVELRLMKDIQQFHHRQSETLCFYFKKIVQCYGPGTKPGNYKLQFLSVLTGIYTRLLLEYSRNTEVSGKLKYQITWFPLWSCRDRICSPKEFSDSFKCHELKHKDVIPWMYGMGHFHYGIIWLELPTALVKLCQLLRESNTFSHYSNTAHSNIINGCEKKGSDH